MAPMQHHCYPLLLSSPPPVPSDFQFGSFDGSFEGGSFDELVDEVAEGLVGKSLLEVLQKQVDQQAALMAAEAEHEAQEDQVFAAAVAASLSDPGPFSPTNSTSPSCPPLPGPSSSALPPPSTILIAPTRCPTITTHLSPTWMRAYQDRSKATVVKTDAHNVEAVLAHKFHVVFWDQDGQPGDILCVHNCPQWLIFRLGERLDVLAVLGNNIDAVDYYDLKHLVWIKTDLLHPYMLSADTYVFLRRRDVTCIDLDDLVRRFSKPVAHLRVDMREEQRLAKQKLQKKMLDVQAEGSDSEIEFVEGDFGAIKRRRGKQGCDLEHPLKYQCLVRTPSPDSPACLHPSLPPPARLDGSALSPIIITEGPAVASPTSITEPALCPWPYGMFTVDMVEGFVRMDKLEHLPVRQQFQEVFNELFVASTYMDQRRRWLRASQEARDHALAGHRSACGLWGVFAYQVWLKQ